jgi:hypothetical protein
MYWEHKRNNQYKKVEYHLQGSLNKQNIPAQLYKWQYKHPAPKPQLPDGTLNSWPRRKFRGMLLEGLVGLESSFGQQGRRSHKEGEVEGVKAWREAHYVINYMEYQL